MTDTTEQKYRDEIDGLTKQIDQFEQKYISNNNAKSKTKPQSHMSYIYNAFAELLGGILTAFVLNKIYVSFFGKNTLVLALLLIMCSLAGLYNFIRYFLLQQNSINQGNNPSENK